MQPTSFKGQHKVLNKPRNWSERQGTGKGLPCYIKSGRVHSRWTFSFAERIKILFGVPLKLTVITQSMPPVILEIKEVIDDAR